MTARIQKEGSFGSEKLLCDLHWGFCAYYDLAADPRERDNLAEKK